MRAPLALLLTCTAALAAGCGSDEGSTGDEPAATPSSTSGNRIVMRDNAFEPRELTVKVGDEVTWVNEDSVPHNAVSDAPGGPKSELFGQGKSYSFTASRPGRIAYVCTIHPGMEGTLSVE